MNGALQGWLRLAGLALTTACRKQKLIKLVMSNFRCLQSRGRLLLWGGPSAMLASRRYCTFRLFMPYQKLRQFRYI